MKLFYHKRTWCLLYFLSNVYRIYTYVCEILKIHINNKLPNINLQISSNLQSSNLDFKDIKVFNTFKRNDKEITNESRDFQRPRPICNLKSWCWTQMRTVQYPQHIQPSRLRFQLFRLLHLIWLFCWPVIVVLLDCLSI